MEKENKARVAVFGTFDMLHEGHKHFLRVAGKQGNSLFVVVAADENVDKIKGMPPCQNQAERMREVEKTGIADEVLPGKKEMGSCSMIEELKPDILCLGYDQKIPEECKEKIDKMKNDEVLDVIKISPHKPHMHKSSIKREGLTKTNKK